MNMSRKGLLLEMEPRPDRRLADCGTVVNLIIELPSEEPSRSPRVLHGIGSVCRVEENGNKVRMAAQLLRMNFTTDPAIECGECEPSTAELPGETELPGLPICAATEEIM